jgi:membrane protein implicated in regulation of membrane protease activity
MNDFLKMDVFFLVTTTVVILLAVFALVALYYIIRILKSVDHVAHNVSEESDSLRDDITVLRAKVREEGMRVQHFLEFFAGITSRQRGRKKPKE